MKKNETYKQKKVIQTYGTSTIIRFNKDEALTWDLKEGDIVEIEMRGVK